MTTADTFDTHISAWKNWQQAPWGRLRYTIASANLCDHISNTPLRVLDVGGGNGLDSIPFAQRGHMVTIADYSAEMLVEAVVVEGRMVQSAPRA